MLRPLPDLNNTEVLAKLGKQYTLRESWRDAVSQLRDSLTEIQSVNTHAQEIGLKRAREAVEQKLGKTATSIWKHYAKHFLKQRSKHERPEDRAEAHNSI